LKVWLANHDQGGNLAKPIQEHGINGILVCFHLQDLGCILHKQSGNQQGIEKEFM